MILPPLNSGSLISGLEMTVCNMHKFLILLCILFSFSPLISIYLKFYSPPPKIIQTLEGQTIELLPEIPSIISRINIKNDKIRTFTSSDFQVHVWQKGRKIHLKGSLYYEKDQKLRLILRSILGKESDLGSNEETFWFWSKRMNDPSLFFAKHSDFHKSRLKSPFNPMYIRDSLGFSHITVEKGHVVELKGRLICVQHMKNSINQPITRFLIIDKKSEKVEGFFISNKKGSLEASGLVTEWDGIKPKVISYHWYEEDITMRLIFDKSYVNVNLDSKIWELPSIQPKVDMGKSD